MEPPRTLLRLLDQVPRHRSGRVDVDRIVDSLGSPDEVCVLESVPASPHAGRWSYVTLPAVGRLVDHRNEVAYRGADGVHETFADPFTALDEVTDRLGLGPDAPGADGGPGFVGGLVGALSYDLGRRIERLPDHATSDRDIPWLDLRVVDTVVAIDHREEEAWLVHRPLGGHRSAAWKDNVAARIAAAPPARPLGPVVAQEATSTLDRPTYEAHVADVLDHIAAGDTFQVNLSQRLTARWQHDVHQLYRALRTASPAPYGAVIPRLTGGSGIASISPETFLDVSGRRVETRPIKGTRPRTGHPRTDEEQARTLARSEKDRAENVMVVDMERNDLGRVCTVGSVHVPRLLDLEAHPTVWHLVSTVVGTLAPARSYGDLLRAAFPCGSITGTPKVRAMEIIDACEPVRRGWYCGAVGYVSAGRMRLSVSIRTATLWPTGAVDYGAGGGIVADSDPAAEYVETLDKAAAFLSAVGARQLRQESP